MSAEVTRLLLAVLVEILEQVLPGQVLAGLDDLGDATVLDLELPRLAALALELEAQLAAVHLDMRVAQRRQAVALVLLGVVANCRRGSGSSRGDARPSPAPFRAAGRAAPCARRSCRIAGSAAANSSMCSYFVLSRTSRKARMVAVLLAPLGVAPGRLDMAVRLRADPHVRIGRRDGERLMRASVAGSRRPRAPSGFTIGKALAGLPAAGCPAPRPTRRRGRRVSAASRGSTTLSDEA